MRSKTVFKSRWWALVWAAGILWAAHDFVEMAHPHEARADANEASNLSDDAQIAALTNQVNALRTAP